MSDSALNRSTGSHPFGQGYAAIFFVLGMPHVYGKLQARQTSTVQPSTPVKASLVRAVARWIYRLLM
ncbi:hypothetical protein [Lyngbya confervoides]|uniref:Transposase n=1 Tax=Lyngbya confervoides BDU141951 TaxID=1574623 RepID=A0ABD4T6P0_9CYAN|nr:hypothetical protein [Lyngbya confervoides]MCM1984232.1 hypothetical protein [Lyngbya confervoides BDU141951]